MHRAQHAGAPRCALVTGVGKPLRIAIAAALSVFAAEGACAATNAPNDEHASSGGGGSGTGQAGGGVVDVDGGGGCTPHCLDAHTIERCDGSTETCTGSLGCDYATGTCIDACAAAENAQQSVGCEYYATQMEIPYNDFCFAAFVANTWNTPAHLAVERNGQALSIDAFTRIPSGSGPALSYLPFDAAAGLPVGEVAILFLGGPHDIPPDPNSTAWDPCPVPSAVYDGAAVYGTAIGDSFRIVSDVPVVAYQMNPYGGGHSAVTGASLLLPTSAWDTSYLAVDAYEDDVGPPAMNIVAQQDGTTVTLVPVAAVEGGVGIPAGPANVPLSFVLDRGQNAQIVQPASLTGSLLHADKPIGVMAGHVAMDVPFGVAYADHAEQMLPPSRALGSEYVGVMYRPRACEPAIWRVIGVVDGTELAWSSPVGGPSTLDRGQIGEFITADPFVVTSQDDKHPFMLFEYMSGQDWDELCYPPTHQEGYGSGDADFVLMVPPDQFLSQYVFFADPSYPETNVVLVRTRSKADGSFHDIDLDCLGTVTGWQPVGDYEWARVDLATGLYESVDGCSTGRHEITSEAPFGIWIWGWGTEKTFEIGEFTCAVSYGYPGGMNVHPINQVELPLPK